MRQSRYTCGGQSTAEYAVLIAVIIAAVLAMQLYVKRAMSGRLRQASDQVGEQFSPAATKWEYTTTSKTNRKDEVFTSGGSKSTVQGPEESTRAGAEHVTDSASGSLF